MRQKSVQWEGQSLTLNFAKHMFRQTVQGVQTRTFQHDALGRLVWEEHPEFYHQWTQYGVSYLYDDAGRMTQKTDPRGIVTTMSYDDLNRPLSVDYSDSTPAAIYTYDQGLYGIGRLSSVSNSVASTSYTYDKMGRTLQQDKTIGGNAFSMSWAYNTGGQVTSYTLPNGTTISRTFNNLGRPTSITSDWVDADHPATLASNFVYHSTGALTSIEYGNGTTSTRSYTSGGLLKTLQHGTPSDPGELIDFEYDYQEGISNNGRIMGITDHNDVSKSQTYTYDGFQRLLTAETDGSHWGLSWGYDRYGNRLTQTVTKGTAPSQSLSFDSLSNRVTGWTYDQAGNTLNDGSHSYAFDANNRTASLDGGSTLYRQDAGGSRVQKVTASQTTSYFFGVAEYVSGSGWSKLYIKLGKEKLLEYSGSTTLYFHADHLGTPKLQTSISGSIDATWRHFPFGEQWSASGPSTNEHRFTGHLRDSESENSYAGARYYSNNTGRWLSVDPAGIRRSQPQVLNRYQYVHNDPINYLDWDGREEEPHDAEVWAWIWGVLGAYGGGRGGGGSSAFGEETRESGSRGIGGGGIQPGQEGPDEELNFGQGIIDCNFSAEQIQEYLYNNFTTIAEHEANIGPFEVALRFEDGAVIADGAQIGISILVGGQQPTRQMDMSVTVETTNNGWIFHTDPGHFADGTITFAVENVSGGISFDVHLQFNHASRIDRLLFERVGRRFEAATWNNLTDKVKEKCAQTQ